ncbi:MAG: ABC transporter permease, partial [Patescibacteria group bacterium]|nr:ABC transporter permease [Patescibacteria group bacterium]
LPYIDKAYSAITAQEVLAWEGNTKRPLIFAVTEDFIDIDSSEIDQGRFFTDEEDRNLARVVVLGQKVKEDLFGASQAVGQSVKIKGQNYRVIGVMKKRGTVFFFNMDDLVYVPLQTTQRFLLGVDHVMGVYARINDPQRTEEAVQAMEHILRENHGITNPDRDDFEVMSMDQAQDMLGTVIGGVTILLLALAGVSLIVGGVGIMNIMYASVAERTFEIGLRKSIGASKKAILQQFLFEAIIITILGGFLGLSLGLIMIYGLYFVAQNYGFDWSLSFSLVGIMVALSFSIAVGLIFGIYPAKKAADLDPISALRKE